MFLAAAAAAATATAPACLGRDETARGFSSSLPEFRGLSHDNTMDIGVVLLSRETHLLSPLYLPAPYRHARVTSTLPQPKATCHGSRLISQAHYLPPGLPIWYVGDRGCVVLLTLSLPWGKPHIL